MADSCNNCHNVHHRYTFKILFKFTRYVFDTLHKVLHVVTGSPENSDKKNNIFVPSLMSHNGRKWKPIFIIHFNIHLIFNIHHSYHLKNALCSVVIGTTIVHPILFWSSLIIMDIRFLMKT